MTNQSSERSLWPKEHGAYGQLALPMLAALSSGRFGLAALLYAGASICAFLAHEPMLVLLGQRGSRALREAGSRARRRAALLACGALLCIGLALALSGPEARLAFVAPLGGACALGLLIWHKQERTDLGELAAACALSATGLPIAITGGLSPQLAFGAWGVWSIGFGLVTLSLRRAIHGRKVSVQQTGWQLIIPALLFVFGWLIARTSIALAVAVLPTAGMALALFVLPPGPKQLRLTGWLLVMSSVATGLLLVLAVRLPGL